MSLSPGLLVFYRQRMWAPVEEFAGPNTPHRYLFPPSTRNHLLPPQADDSGVMTIDTHGLLKLTDGRLVSWAGDEYLRVWDDQTGTELQKFPAKDIAPIYDKDSGELIFTKPCGRPAVLKPFLARSRQVEGRRAHDSCAMPPHRKKAKI